MKYLWFTLNAHIARLELLVHHTLHDIYSDFHVSGSNRSTHVVSLTKTHGRAEEKWKTDVWQLVAVLHSQEKRKKTGWGT